MLRNPGFRVCVVGGTLRALAMGVDGQIITPIDNPSKGRPFGTSHGRNAASCSSRVT